MVSALSLLLCPITSAHWSQLCFYRSVSTALSYYEEVAAIFFFVLFLLLFLDDTVFL